jgi:hypothetical protein
MTALSDMSAAGSRILDLLTASEAAARLTRGGYGRYSADRVLRLVFGALVRITPESVAAYLQRLAAETNLGDPR